MMTNRRFSASIAAAILLVAVFIFTAGICRAAEDTDGDGYGDAEEIANGYSPYNPEAVSSGESDMDEDGLSDHWENIFGTDPFRADTDGDGYGDFQELDRAYDPRSPEPKRLSQRVDVDRQKQQMTYVLDGKAWQIWRVSTGRSGMATPAGEFKVVNKSLKPWSRSYGLWMPYWLGLGGSGLRNGSIGIHELPVWPGGYREGEDHLGKPVSHGCIRLGIGPAQYLYERVPVGTVVVIN